MPNTVDGARKVMQQNNIPTNFLDKAVSVISPFSAFFGVKKDQILNDAQALKGNTSTNARQTIGTPRNLNTRKNNYKSKYPKI